MNIFLAHLVILKSHITKQGPLPFRRQKQARLCTLVAVIALVANCDTDICRICMTAESIKRKTRGRGEELGDGDRQRHK